METKLDIRNTCENDYVELCDWWVKHRFGNVPRYILPDNISSGLMVSFNGENICAGFVYKTSSSSFFYVEWIVSTYKRQFKDKTENREFRDNALKYLINGLVYMCKEMGAKTIYTSLRNPNLINKYSDCGFVLGSSNTQEMVFVVK